MKPSVSIILANGNIGGSVNTTDGITGVVITGSGTGTVALLAPKKVFSLADAETQGFTVTAEPIANRIIKEFYSIDGTLGIPLYIMLTAETTLITSLCDKDNANGIAKLVDFANGSIRLLAIGRKPGVAYVPASEEFIDVDVIEAVANAKAFVADRFAKIQPLRIILEARINDEDNATIFLPNTAGANAVAFAIGGTVNDGSASLGLILGRKAAVPVQRNIGRVKDGALPATAMFIGSKKIEAYAGLGELIDGGYITFTNYPQKAGYYISDDPMAVAETDDYRFLTNCLVIDKASIIAYQTYIEELKDDVDLDSSGKIEPIILSHLEATIENNISLAMSANISGTPRAFIDPTQNLASGSKLKVQLRIRPKGYLKEIEVDLGFGITN